MANPQRPRRSVQWLERLTRRRPGARRWPLHTGPLTLWCSWRRWALQSLLLWCCLGATAAQAAQPLPEALAASSTDWFQVEGLPGLSSRQVWTTDPGGQRTIEDLQIDGAFTPATTESHFFDHSTPRWMRIDLKVPPELIGADAWLRLTPSLILEAVLFQPDGRMQRSGLSVPQIDQTHAGYPVHFYLRLDHPDMRVYLKVTSALPLLTHVMLLSDRAMGLEILRDNLRQGLFLGASLLVVMLSLINWVSTREAVHLSFALYIGSFLLFYAFVSGYASFWLLPAAPILNITLTTLVFALLVAALIRFAIEIMELQDRMPRIARALKSASWLVIGTGFLALEFRWLVPVAWALWFTHFVFGLLLLGLSLYQALVRRHWQGWVLFSSFLIFTLFEKLPLFSALGLVPVYPWVFDVAKLGLVIQLVLTQLHLVMRFKEQQSLKNDALTARMEARAERDHRQGLIQFLSMFGHEVRTPLAIIDAATQSLELLPGASAPAIRQRHQRIRAAVRRLTELSHEALSHERLENSRWTPQRRVVDFKALQQELFEWLDITAAPVVIQRDQVFHWRVGGQPGALSLRGFDPPPNLVADPGMLLVALRNLLDNARKYADPGSTVRLTVSVRRGRVRLQVGSLGPALSAHEREQMFLRYWRRDEHSNVAGAGLGLALVQQIVQAHRGTVEVQSRYQRWTWIILTLPGRQK